MVWVFSSIHHVPVKPQSVMTGTSVVAFYTDWKREEIRTRQPRNQTNLKCQA